MAFRSFTKVLFLFSKNCLSLFACDCMRKVCTYFCFSSKNLILFCRKRKIIFASSEEVNGFFDGNLDAHGMHFATVQHYFEHLIGNNTSFLHDVYADMLTLVVYTFSWKRRGSKSLPPSLRVLVAIGRSARLRAIILS